MVAAAVLSKSLSAAVKLPVTDFGGDVRRGGRVRGRQRVVAGLGPAEGRPAQRDRLAVADRLVGEAGRAAREAHGVGRKDTGDRPSGDRCSGRAVIDPVRRREARRELERRDVGRRVVDDERVVRHARAREGHARDRDGLVLAGRRRAERATRGARELDFASILVGRDDVREAGEGDRRGGALVVDLVRRRERSVGRPLVDREVARSTARERVVVGRQRSGEARDDVVVSVDVLVDPDVRPRAGRGAGHHRGGVREREAGERHWECRRIRVSVRLRRGVGIDGELLLVDCEVARRARLERVVRSQQVSGGAGNRVRGAALDRLAGVPRTQRGPGDPRVVRVLARDEPAQRRR